MNPNRSSKPHQAIPRALANFIAAANAVAVNPLHALCLIAVRNLIIARNTLPMNNDGLPLAPWLGSFAAAPFPVAPDGATLYDSVEFAGEAALYRHLNADPDLEILLTGAVVWQLRGIDAIVRRKSDGVFILCEAKGSSRPLAASPLTYLPETKTKGRQLGWQWCWNSLVDMAEHPATAAAFLVLLQPMLNGRVERLLTITRAARENGGWRCAETRVYPEAQLCTYAPLALPYLLDKQKQMFVEMADSSDGAVLLNVMAKFFVPQNG